MDMVGAILRTERTDAKMSTNPNSAGENIRYTRQSIITNTFYQMPRFLMAGEFFGDKMSNNARVLYTLLLNRHRLSVKNGWQDENGDNESSALHLDAVTDNNNADKPDSTSKHGASPS